MHGTVGFANRLVLVGASAGLFLMAHGIAGGDMPADAPATGASGTPANVYASRSADWRNGALIYQVIVDRFAPSADLEAKRHLYPDPKKLRAWAEKPKRGQFLPEVQVWSQEIDFWGGDLQSLIGKLDYIADLGMEVLYLNPICKAYTNHKYDAQDYFAVSPEYGTRQDLRALADALHSRDMYLMLDGVFNHMGRTAPWFADATSSPDSPYRDWFYIGEQYKLGYRAWADVANLPELNLEHPKVRARIYGDEDSVVQGYLRDGVDGWRLDVAFDLGFDVLAELTAAAHATKPGSAVVGEIWNYPEQWSPAVDAVMNFHALAICDGLVSGRISGDKAGRMLARMIEDAGIDPILKAWLVLDNHDVPRLKTRWPHKWQQRMLQVLQFTLPGAPCVYYGVELGMKGGDDPEQRGPMRWNLVTDENVTLEWFRKLVAMREDGVALKVGDFRLLDSEELLAFQRSTDRTADTRIVVANPTKAAITEVLAVRDSKLMNWSLLKDELGDAEVRVDAGTIQANLPAHTVWVLKPVMADTIEYTPYKRVP